MIKRILNLAFYLTVLGGAVYLATHPALVLEIRKTVGFPPEGVYSCSSPINYSLGVFSDKFGITQSDFLLATKEAETIWEKPLGQDLFNYNQNGELKINLIFDERQIQTQEVKNIMDKISTNEEKYNALKNEYDKLIALYDQKRSLYDSKYAEAEIINNKRKVDRESLQILAQELDALKEEVNGLASQIKNMEPILNELAQKINLNIGDYNNIQSDRGEFQTGQYKMESGTTEINIFQFQNYDELVLILTHELGHALGIEHASSTSSIMYPLVGKQAQKLSAEDISLYKVLCP